MGSDRLFFYSGSADRPPGRGSHDAVADPSVYAQLARARDWRKMLSNFWVAEFSYDGATYRTVEHCFQAAKISIADPELAKGFAVESGSALALGDGAMARSQRKLVLLDDNQLTLWERRKHVTMQTAMAAKFSQHPDLMAVLQATGDAELWHGAGRGSPPQRVHDLEAVRSEARGDALPRADIVFRFESRIVAGLVLDGGDFPWYEGALIEGPGFESAREFLARYHEADLEFDFAPYHPHEGAYESSDLAKYVANISGYREHRRPMSEDDDRSVWLLPWRDANDATLTRYIEFLDWRRWKAVYRAGSLELGIALPPSLDFADKRYAFRPA